MHEALNLFLNPTFDFRFFFTITCMVLAGASATKAFIRLFKILGAVKKEPLKDDLPERLQAFTWNVLLQKKLFKDFWPGLQHALIFWGFIIITIGTAEHIIEGLFHGFSFDFLGPVYSVIVFAQDIFHPIVFAAVLFGIYRRLVVKPKRLSADRGHLSDAMVILLLTGGLMIANMLTFAAYVHANYPHAVASARPVSRFLAQFFGQMPPDTAMFIGHIGWAVHLATVFYFAHYIPNSKHLHVVAAGFNFLFARIDNKGSFRGIDFTDETATQFGVAKLQDFTWKDILDTYSCTACGRYIECVPLRLQTSPYVPLKLIEDIKTYALTHGPELAKNPEYIPPFSLVSEESGITHDTLWACTSCRACVEACPVGIEHIDKIVDMRRNLVMMEGSMPAELQTTMRNWENQSNPWGMPQDSRDEWAKDLGVKRLADHPNTELVFYVGCAGSFNDRNKKISTALVKILQAAKIDFAILGKEELCNGETARRAGNEYLAKVMADANIEVLKKYNIKNIIATCPHCFNTLKNEYPEYGFQLASIYHHTEYIQKLIENGSLKLNELKKDLKIAYHDSCYLGRYNEVYEEPRDTLKSIGGVELVEMPRNRTKGLCCGAGGARMWMEETIGKRINVERVEEALEAKPDVIAAGCPFCQVMLDDGVTEKGKNKEVAIKDIAEIVAEQI
ncbi:MAG: (Fe-S)-binding protein [Bdellovibrionota bacterium]